MSNVPSDCDYSEVDIEGLMRLVTGIIKRAKEDYIRGKYSQRKDVERFMKSEYYHILTDLNNAGLALEYWEEKRKEELGEGKITFPGVKLFLVEGLIEQKISYDKKRRHQIIVTAENAKNASQKAFDYGILCNNDYTITELKGVNEKCSKKLQKSKNGLLMVKDESI